MIRKLLYCCGPIFTGSRNWTNLIEYFTVTPSYVQTLSDGTVITHSFKSVGTQALSHSVGVAFISILDNSGTNVYGSTLFANTGAAGCPLPGVPIELIRDNGQVMKTNSAADGTFSFSISLGEPVQVRIPPYNAFAWSASYYPITATSTGRRLLSNGSPTGTPTFVPTNPPVTKIAKLPTGAPSKSPVSSPTKRPISIPTQPSTGGPTVPPTSSPSSPPSASPTTSSPTLMHFSNAEMIHRFTFDYTSATNPTQIPDTINDNYYSAIHNGVTLSDSLAVFKQTVNPAAQPYLALSQGWFGIADAISIEMWVTVDSATQDNAVLFSFGDPSTPDAYVSLNAKGFQGFINTYLAVVVNPSIGLMQVYINGALNSNTVISTNPLFNGNGASEKFNCIGWDLKKTTPGFIGSIDEIRFWDGALTPSNITETAILGVNPSLVILDSNDTFYNIQIDYQVTNEVVTNVGFYGGLSHNKIFGSESEFLIEALDPQCAFNITVALDPFYSGVSVLLPAMNYSVTLKPYATPLPAPTFTYPLCSPSLDPYSYLAAADELSVQIYTDLLVTFNLYATFIYHTGLCMSIKGAENFAASEPTPDKQGRACYSNSATMLQRGQVWPLNITLFELYPAYSGNNPAWDPTKVKLDVDSGTAVQDLVVLDSTVEITDIVSGFSSAKTYVYSDVLYTNASMESIVAPPDLNYTITAGTPLPSAPYALPFSVLATRNSPEGAAQVSLKAFIPILGTLPSEVPNFYPVTTDPTLIFLILRDPPGGNSQTTISAGSIFTTGITIDGMQTFDQDLHFDVEVGAGEEEDMKALTAPLGIGVSIDEANEKFTGSTKGSLIAPDVNVTRTSDTHYSYAFTFAYDFSTSAGTLIAGHPSDVIIGGGIDVIVSEAIEGDIQKDFSMIISNLQ